MIRLTTKKSIVEVFERAQDSLVLQSSDLSLETIAKMVNSHAIDVAPRYQRRERWPHEAQSALIESFLINVPVPPVYLAEDDYGNYSVIDGKQRITAIAKFLSDDFPLKSLQRFTQLEGQLFSELPTQLRNALTIRPYLRVVTLLKQSAPELKYEVFTRLNTGGQPLLAQEIRNALYRGPLNEMLFLCAKTPFLLQQMKIKTKKESAYSEMQDVEMVLRFFTMHETWRTFSGDYRRSMDKYMTNHLRDNTVSLRKLKATFTNTLKRCDSLWGDHAFKRFTGGAWRDQFLSALYDAQMIAASTMSQARFIKLSDESAKILNVTKALFSDPQFEESVRVSTNTPSRVRYRVDAMISALESI